MPLYMVSYDIAEQDAPEYGPLWELLIEWKAHRLLKSQWVFVSSSESATQIADLILTSVPLRVGDRLLVQEVTKNVGWWDLELADPEAIIVLNAARP